MVETKVKNLLSDEKALKEFLSFSKPEDAQKFLESHGIESSKEELKIIADMLNKYEEKGDFLNDAELENIAGGVNYFITKTDAEKNYNALNKEAKNDLITSGIFAAGAGLCAGVAACLTEDKDSGVAIGVGASVGALALYKLIKSGKNKYDASWWKRLSNSLS